MSGNQSSSMPFIQNLSNLCQNLVDIGISTCEQKVEFGTVRKQFICITIYWLVLNYIMHLNIPNYMRSPRDFDQCKIWRNKTWNNLLIPWPAVSH